MSVLVPGNGSNESYDGQWVVTMANGLVAKIERLDAATDTRQEMSADDYASFVAGHYAIYCAAYYAGVRDYAQAIVSGNTEVALAHYQGMNEFFVAMGQM
jgi:hypothetical protein